MYDFLFLSYIQNGFSFFFFELCLRVMYLYMILTIVCLRIMVPVQIEPAAFEKHSGRETARKWKNNIWVIVDGEKVPLFKTALLKYYNRALTLTKTANNSQTGRACHRDEFIRCTQCSKLRRFRLRTKDECRTYHDAFIDDDWKCSDMPYDKYVFVLHNVHCMSLYLLLLCVKLVVCFRVTCDDDEERGSRRVYRGCVRSTTCKGCTTCVCFGCVTCRFSDCGCQTCIDFTTNSKA
ncbi:putative transcription factor ULT family [Helianthus annuus]|nr:putative transcription factor ULT family [Helianthus annuus]